jgi:large subunit ribosomal protein L9
MKVILCEDVDNVGEMGETVKVSPGFARNFLIPRRLAVSADSASAHQIEHEMRIIRKREEKRRKELGEVAKGMNGLRVEFTAKVGEEGKLFGSVTNLHIAEKLAEHGHVINRKKIILTEPIKTLGEHTVSVRLKSGIEASIVVVVEPEVAEAPPPVEEESETVTVDETGASAEAEVAAETAAATEAPETGSAEPESPREEVTPEA